MNAARRLSFESASEPVLADDILEFHAARILLLLKLCGTASKGDKSLRIDGLTKLAKLDFFVRYPQFFARAAKEAAATTSVESSMVRFHYGPWDKRYYQVIAYLEARGLLRVEASGSAFVFRLTEPGAAAADDLAKSESYEQLVAHMKKVKKAFGAKPGSTLKKLIYDTFKDEIAAKPLDEVIR